MTQQTLHLRAVRTVHGTLTVPGDKSISHRCLLLGAVARGSTSLTNLAPGADVAATAECLRSLGVTIDATGPHARRLEARGWAGLRSPQQPLDAANSGTTMRLMAGLLAGRPLTVTLIGDASLSRRPMRRVLDPLLAMGARVSADQGRAPITIEGGLLHAIDWSSPVASAQVKSAVMLAALSATGTTSVTEPHPTRDHTERLFPVFGLDRDVAGLRIRVPGGQEATAPGPPIDVPGDPSSAAVWAAAAAALPGSAVRIEGICLNPRRLGFVAALRRMGADIRVDPTGEAAGELVGALEVRHGSHGADTVIAEAEVPDLIDELPVLAARAALGGSLEVSGASELRVKESDRISTLVAGLRALGVRAEERPDGFVIDGSQRPAGGTVDAAGDHRLVMAFGLVGLGATGPTTITGAQAVGVSYPQFEADLARLTA